jgi:hypothetical protein
LPQLTGLVAALRAALAALGVERSDEDVALAFRAEVAHYRPRAHEGRDAATLARCGDCVAVFLHDLGDPPGRRVRGRSWLRSYSRCRARRTLRRLRQRGLKIGVVANWDRAPPSTERLVLARSPTVVTSARAGVAKPDPAIFELALAGSASRRPGTARRRRALRRGRRPRRGPCLRARPLSTAFAGWE